MFILSKCGVRGSVVDFILKSFCSRSISFLLILSICLSAVSSSIYAGSANLVKRSGSGVSSLTLPVAVTAPTALQPTPSTFVVPISVNDITGEGIIAFQFNILYNPLVINPFGPNFGCSTVGTIAGAAGLGPTCNVVMGDAGRLRISVSGANPMNGIGTVLNLTFQTAPGAFGGDVSPLIFEPATYFFFRGGPMAGPVPVDPTNGQITLLGPSAATASIGGKVTTSTGRGINGAVITVSGGELSVPRMVRTGSFGYFTIEDLLVGQTYVVSINSKRFIFSVPSRAVTLADNVEGIDFVADPQ